MNEIQLFVQPLLILALFVDVCLAACLHPARVRVLGYRQRLTILRPVEYLDESFRILPSLDIPDNDSGLCDCETFTQKENKSTFLNGEKVCPLPPRNGKPVGHINDTCPLYYQMNYDQFRVPQYIAEVRCSCDGCITKAPNGSWQIFHDGECREVKVTRQVLRKCKEGKNKYVVRYEKYAVGCTCKFIKDSSWG